MLFFSFHNFLFNKIFTLERDERREEGDNNSMSQTQKKTL